MEMIGVGPLSISLLFGSVAMLLWGLYDFVAKVLLRNRHSFQILFLTQLSGTVLLLVFSIRSFDLEALKPYWMASLAMFGVLYAMGYWSLLRALESGDLSTVSPVAAGSAALATVLGVLLLSEKLAPPLMLGVVLAIVGVILISTSGSSSHGAPIWRSSNTAKRIPKGVPYALVTFLSWGLLYILLKLADRELQALSVVMIMRVFALLLLMGAVVMTPLRGRLRGVTSRVALLLVVMGVMDVAAIVSVNWGLAAGYVTVVSPISSAYPAVSICLALAFLRERPTLLQAIGITGVLISVVVLSLSH
jgi:uncharacterized membrane protein